MIVTTLLIQYAMQYIRGMQISDDRGFMKTICNAKHFSGYDVESGEEAEGRGNLFSFCITNMTYFMTVLSLH